MAIRINVPPVTRLLLTLLLGLSALNIILVRRTAGFDAKDSQGSAALYLTLHPWSWVQYPWTILSSAFVEQNLVPFLLSGANILFGGRYLERAWGSKEFAKVVLVASAIPNLLVVPLYITANYAHGTWWSADLSGGTGLQAAFLVAFKQLVPEHTVALFRGLVKVRVKHFPALFLLINTIAAPLLGSSSAALHAWVGLLTSWTYLRFYKRQPDLSAATTGRAELRGDASETFAFAAFFPDKIQSPIMFASDQIYSVLVALRICTPFSDEEIESGNQQAASRGEAGLPSLLNNGARTGRPMGKREEAERRRALALQALDQRLSLANNKPANNQPAPAAAAPIPSTDGAAIS